MNRYTQLSTTQFNPLSIEELSLAPVAMRQKHDASNLQLENTRTQMNAAIDALPQHSERASQLVSQMNKLIDSESEKLAKNGYTNMTGSNLTKLNRDYQSIMSPNGELGKIASAKKAYAENYKQFVEDAQKKGHTLADIQRNWQDHNNSYFGYDSEGKVANIGLIGAPDKYDPIDAVKEIQPLIGETQRRLDQMGGGSVSMENGLLVVRNKSGAVHQLTNAPQIQQANQYLQAQFFTPGSKGFESSRFKGKDFRAVNSEINGLLGMMIKDKITDTRSTSVSASQLRKEDGDGSGAGGLGPYSSNLMNTGNRFDFSSSKYNTRESVANRLKELGSDKTKMTDEQREEYDLLKGVENRYSEALASDRQYQEALKIVNASKAAIGKTDANIKTPKDMSGRSTIGLDLSSIRLTTEASKDPRLAEAVKTMQSIEKSTFQNLPTRVSSYVVPRSSDAKSNKSIQAADDNLLTIFRNGMGGIDNNMVIKSITNDDSDVYTYNKLGESAQQGIKGLLRNAKNVQILGTEVNPLTNKSELIVNIETDGKTKSSLGWGRGTSGGTGNTTVRLELKNTENAVGVSTIMGNIANHYHNYGGPEGKVFASQIASSASKLKSNSDFEKAGFTYGHLNEFSNQMDPVTSRLVQDKIINSISAEKGINPQEIQSLPTNQLNKLVNDYINNHSQEQIMLY